MTSRKELEHCLSEPSKNHSRMRIVLSLALSLLAFEAVGSSLMANESSDQRMERMKAEFERRRSSNLSKFSADMERRRQSRHAERQRQAQSQFNQASRMKVTPGQCALAFNASLRSARKFQDVDAFFSRHYIKTYMRPDVDKVAELESLRKAYMATCKVRGTPKISSKGESSVCLEGADVSGKSGIRVKLRMIPESNYWRIDGYEAETGLQYITFPTLK